MAKKTQTVHFTLGQDFGIRLMEIAQEHLIYNYNPNKAVKIITESLMGCPVELALKIIKGDMLIVVNEDEQNVYVTERQNIEDQERYPFLDIKNWYIRKAASIIKKDDNLRYGVNTARDKFLIKSTYKKEFDYDTIMEFCSGNTDALYNVLINGDESFDNDKIDAISYLAMLVKGMKNYIEETTKIQNTINWLREKYPSEFIDERQYIENWNFYNNALKNTNNEFIALLEGDYLSDYHSTKFPELDRYIEATKEIDTILSKGIEPVNIMNNWSAGWLAPNGDYYGLNGEIANMLHNQIADALYEAGIIPKSGDDEELDENRLNPDAWLGQHGWVKIHGNNVQFEGCLNYKIGERNVDMTAIQIKKIYEYCSICHKGRIKLGWRMELTTTPRFQMMAENLEQLYKDYFEF